MVTAQPSENCRRDFQQAQELHQAERYSDAVRIYERLVDGECSDDWDFLSEIFYQAGVVHRIMYRFAEGEATLKRALEIRENKSGVDHPSLIPVLNEMAWLYTNKGDYTRSWVLLERALAIGEQNQLNEHPDIAQSLNNMAYLCHEQSAYQVAKPLAQKGLAMRRRIFADEHFAIAESLDNLGTIYRKLGDYSNAEKSHKQAIAIRDKTLAPDHSNTAESLYALASIYRRQGKYKEAETAQTRALEIRKNRLGPEHPHVAVSLNSLGLLYLNLGKEERAKPLYLEALKVKEKSLGRYHDTVALQFNNIGYLYRDLGEYERAESAFRQAVSIREKIFEPDHLELGFPIRGLGRLYQRMGRYDEAEIFLKRALNIWENSYGPEHLRVAQVLTNLAELYYLQGDYLQAESVLRRAFPIAVRNNWAKLAWSTHTSFSRILAARNYPDAAILFGKQAVNIFQKLRANMASMGKTIQHSFLQDKVEVYQHLAGLLIDQGRLPEAQQVLAMLKEEEYFEFIRRDGSTRMDTTKATYTAAERVWIERYAGIQHKLISLGREYRTLRKKENYGLSGKEKQRLEKLREKITVINEAFQDNDGLSTEEKQRLDNLPGKIAVISDDFEVYLKGLKAGLGNLSSEHAAEEIGEENLKALQDVLGRLGKGTVLLHYVMTADKLRIILTAPDIQVARNAAVSAKELNRKIFKFREVLDARTKDIAELATDLYDWIIGPIAADLKKAEARVLMVSLDGTLRYIPIAALYDGKDYVAQRFAVVNYTEAAKNMLELKPGGDWNLAGLGLTREIPPDFSPLPMVKDELDRIIRLHPKDEGIVNGVMYLDKKFTADKFLDVLDMNYPLLHIASHFRFVPGTEQASFLVLGDGSRLTLDKIRALYDFQGVELLTLSACNTAIGDNSTGSEVEGFGVLAQNRNARSVLATLWAVDDESTAQFMYRLYLYNVSSSLNKAKSLQKVQQAFIAAGNPDAKTALPEYYAHPYYWAPFILMGNWL